MFVPPIREKKNARGAKTRLSSDSVSRKKRFCCIFDAIEFETVLTQTGALVVFASFLSIKAVFDGINSI